MSSTRSKSTSPDRAPRLGALLRLGYQTIAQQLAAWLAASEYRGVQPAHSAAIQPLWDQPAGLRLTELAARARITKQATMKLVDRLEQLRLVERAADPDDRRASRVRLTSRGHAFARDVRRFMVSVEAELAERIGAEHVENLRAALQRMYETATDRDPEE